MRFWSIPCALLAIVAAHRIAHAETCALLTGDPALVRDTSARLASHGIATDETPGCTAVHVVLSRRADAIVVAEDTGQGPAHECVVSELDTAATVIESWTRSDLDTSAFAFHVLRPRLATSTIPPQSVTVEAPMSAPARPTTTVQAFGAFEASFANDRTDWLGVSVGACVRVGTLCAFVRGRVAAVVQGPGLWAERERHAADLLFGGDVPRDIGPTMLWFGFGVGMGATHTGVEEPAGMRGSETFGLRADAHVEWLVPLGHSLALDLCASVDLAQVTDVETSSTMRVADEPRMLGRFSAGLHMGGR